MIREQRTENKKQRYSISLFAICYLLFTICSCYFSNVPARPNVDAFRIANSSPFINGGQKITGMAVNGSTVVAVSYEGAIAFSEDHGVNWIAVDSMKDPFPDGINFNAVTWGEGFFLAGGNAGKAAYSPNGRDWYAGVIGPMNPKNILAVAAGNMRSRKVFAAAGTDGRIAYALGSPAGPWFQVEFSPFGELEGQGESINALVYGKVRGAGVFVAVGDTGNAAVLNDFSGSVYGPASAGTRQAFRGIGFGNDRFIAVGDGALMKISADPEKYEWTTIRETGFGLMNFMNIGFYPGLNFFVLTAEGSVVGYSDHGEIWSAANFTKLFTQGISAIACTNKKIILGGEDGTIAYSN